ncbi:hypothetical protein [Pseudonocardia sp. DLS-67]
MTTSDRHADLNPTRASTGYPEQSRAGTGQRVGDPAEARTRTDAARRNSAADSHATDTHATGTATPSGGRHEPDSGTREALVPGPRSAAYSARWDEVKGGFVDEPRQAVAAADQLVSELLEELQELFRNQRHDIEQGLAADESSTEDLRVALRRYRSFFDRLLSV